MKKVLKTIVPILVALVLAASLAGCGIADKLGLGQKTSDAEAILRVSDAGSVDRLDEIKLTGRLVVATCGDYPPFEYADDESALGVSGSDIELAQYIADSLGVTLEVYVTDFDDALARVASGEADLAIAAISPTDERAESMLFSLAYNGTYQIGLMALDPDYESAEQSEEAAEAVQSETAAAEDAEATEDAQTQEDAIGDAALQAINKPEIRIGAVAGSVQERYAVELIPYATHVSLDKISAGIEMLKSGELDFIALEIPTGESYVARTEGVVMTEYVLDTPTGEMSVAMPPGQDALQSEVNAIIEKIMTDDLYTGWLEQYRALVEENGI